jgi:cytochrome c553
MKKILAVLLIALSPSPAVAAEGLEWAYAVTPRHVPSDNVVLRQVPGSDKKYTQTQIDDPFSPPDWHPGDHPPMPPVVRNGVKPGVSACALCHLPTGDGHPESARLAGLSASYIVREMSDFKERRVGVRTGVMVAIAQAISQADIDAAANYFASLKPRLRTKVVETDTVPKTYIGPGGMRFAVADGGSEPIGTRIISLPEDAERALSRDPRSGFIDYVPVGSLKRGEALVTAGGGKTVPCAVCHGPALRGHAEVPPIAGMSGLYLVRQLNDIQNGYRSGADLELMKALVGKLDAADMVAIAAYVTSLEP